MLAWVWIEVKMTAGIFRERWRKRLHMCGMLTQGFEGTRAAGLHHQISLLCSLALSLFHSWVMGRCKSFCANSSFLPVSSYGHTLKQILRIQIHSFYLWPFTDVRMLQASIEDNSCVRTSSAISHLQPYAVLFNSLGSVRFLKEINTFMH